MISISSINNCPVKTLSFQRVKYSIIKKDRGIANDRIFAFSRAVDLKKAKLCNTTLPNGKIDNSNCKQDKAK